MGTIRAASFSRATVSPTLATAASGQLLHTAGPATITVVANANGQTLVVQPTAIVNHSSPPHHITIDRNNCSTDNVLLNDKRSPLKNEESLLGNCNDNNTDDRLIERGAQKTIVENTHYITVPVQEAETITPDTVTHPTYVQYVDGSTDQTIYTSNGQMAYPVYTVGSDSGTTLYTSTGQYFQPNNGTPVAYSQVIRVANNLGSNGNQAQIINNGSYLIQQHVDSDGIITATARSSPTNVASDVSYLVNSTNGNNITTVVATAASSNNANNSADNTNSNSNDSASNITHVTRIPPITVQWLLDNYETADGVSLPRSTLYYYYMHHCNESKLDPVNAASFGKLIRSVFLGLRTRRLGTRGNSKYHYYGIRLKANSPLHNLLVQEENGTSQNRPNGNNNQSQKKFKSIKSDPNDSHYNDQNYSNNNFNSETSQQSQNRQFLGDGSSAIPDFPEITFNKSSLPDDCSLEDVDTFRSIYREHCEMFLHAIENLEFATIESLWREFWRCEDTLEDCEEEKYLSKTKLYLLSKCTAVQQFVRHVDYRFYQNLVSFLVPNVLRPIPSSLTQSIRNFAKSLESWLTSAMSGCPKDMVFIKVTAVGAFSQTLRRYTSLNHLAQAARAVLQNSTQINQMLADLNRVDFHNVQEQASWVCQCDTALVERLEEDFKSTLQQQNSLEEWANWLKSVVDEVLKPHEGKNSYIKAARQFLLKWSFYSSMVIRDLTLRSAASFGSFHLIRLLYDEYMFYIIEHQIAEATGETPIAVMGAEKYLSNSPSIIECSLMDDSSDCGNDEISIEQLDETTSSLLIDPADIHIISPPKRMKFS